MTDILVAALAALIAGLALGWFFARDRAVTRLLIRSQRNFASVEITFTGVGELDRQHVKNCIIWSIEQGEKRVEERG